MTGKDEQNAPIDAPPIFVASGGLGAIGEEVVRSALAQFQGIEVPVIVVSRIRRIEQIEELIEQAVASNGMIVHTMVDADMRQVLLRLARQHKVMSIDLMGHLMARLTAVLGRKPLGRPGLYRRLREAYYERIEAIEFTVAHDDGRNTHELHMAEIVLIGVSRAGKTPLSMYLSVLGWKVANVPLVKQIPPPPELFQIDRRRVIGLTIDPGQLVSHRHKRQTRLGMPLGATYTDYETIYEDVENARRICRRGGFTIVDVTDKPIEESADEIISRITRPGQSHLTDT